MWFNPLIRWLVGSRLHFLVSGSIMLMTYRGRKSGKIYTIPMNYLVVTERLYTISSRDRVWWRNLLPGADVLLRLKGRDVPARAEAIVEHDQVVQNLALLIRNAPQMAKYIGVKIDANGAPDPDDIVREAAGRVIVRSHLIDKAPA